MAIRTYHPRDLQEILGLSRSKVYAMIKQETFPAIRVGRQYLIEENALREWLARYAGKKYYL